MAAILSSISPSDSKRTLHKATDEDIPAIKGMIDAAYSKYIERIGKPPAPMTEDWDDVIRSHEVLILRDNERIVGSITFHKDEQTPSLKIDNVVVNPTAQSQGYGYYMIKYAEMEGQKQGLPSVTLFTNVKMYENIAYYTKLGFTETERRVEDGFERIYFYKNLCE
ncbi:Acyl-CoA N-acyltransferase [Penicillium cf. griseofulvum]|uniref:Acyl-CoA N-acyltransferase n=1 Tax=Penicillium cf. griseofulvum TaxID=2972120 RepID=A0A9W9MFX9_9EURO|nr:Acyl-CoA N-acyltransferase [Penicillium cf. griseofulvum]KAJ5424226.1 Acyl-CoA N-acyltransferase [Penicillium cf. griseofulvum]KAJ5442535.1 Acyl-CoA N-acyltransferase [Penicillium cf. griseofulvum]